MARKAETPALGPITHEAEGLVQPEGLVLAVGVQAEAPLLVVLRRLTLERPLHRKSSGGAWRGYPLLRKCWT